MMKSMNLMTNIRFSVCKDQNEINENTSCQDAFRLVKMCAGIDISEAVFFKSEGSIKSAFASDKDEEPFFEMPSGRYTFSQETINGSLGEQFDRMPPHVILRLLVDDHHNVIQFWTPANS